MITFTNVKSREKVTREDTKEEEFIYEGKPLLLETDMDGVITYANRRFMEISGYTKEQIIGSPHCAHMHPNMPQSVFKDACQKTSVGKTWSRLYLQYLQRGNWLLDRAYHTVQTKRYE